MAETADMTKTAENAERRARIALLLPRFGRYGGAEGFGYRLAAVLAENGYAVDFLCGRAEAAPPPGVRIVALGRPGPFKVVKALWFAFAAERRRRAGSYDLSIGLGPSLRQDVLRMGGGALDAFWERSRLAWPKGPARSWKMLCRRLRPGNWAVRWIEAAQYAPENTGLIVCNSHFVRDELLRVRPEIDPARIRIIYNRPDLSRFAPPTSERRAELRRGLGLGGDDVLLATAGTNFALKGVGTLLRALARLPENYRLRVAGGRGAGRWMDLARSLGVAARVDFAGRVDDMPSFYAACDVFVLPTFYDACSNAVTEGLACGRKVISSATNGSAYFLPPERVLADPADDAALARLVRSAAAAPDPGPFAWPEDLACGLEPYLELVAELLEKKGK